MANKIEYSKKWAQLIAAAPFLLKDMPTITAYLDTGYGPDEVRKILKRMWSGKLKGKDINRVHFCVYLFKWIKKEEDKKYVDGICDGELKFSSHWNGGKINCTTWTSIRMWNEKKYKVGGLYRIYWPEEVRKMKREEKKKKEVKK